MAKQETYTDTRMSKIKMKTKNIHIKQTEKETTCACTVCVLFVFVSWLEFLCVVVREKKYAFNHEYIHIQVHTDDMQYFGSMCGCFACMCTCMCVGLVSMVLLPYTVCMGVENIKTTTIRFYGFHEMSHYFKQP